jgi:hypothetical protein
MPAYAIFLYHDPTEKSDDPVAQRRMHHDHADQLKAGGKMGAAIALLSHDLATSIRSGGVVTDGPFIESKEVIAGLYLYEAADLDEAIAHAKENPILMQARGGLEVRPVEGYYLSPGGGYVGTDDGPI